MYLHTDISASETNLGVPRVIIVIFWPLVVLDPSNIVVLQTFLVQNFLKTRKYTGGLNAEQKFRIFSWYYMIHDIQAFVK